MSCPRRVVYLLLAALSLVWSPCPAQCRDELLAPDSLGGARLGSDCALSGDLAIAGAPFAAVGGNSQQGAAYLFRRSNGAWSFEARLVAADGARLDRGGTSVDVEGAVAVVGAPDHFFGRGAVYVFRRSGSAWVEEQKLVPSDRSSDARFGASVSVSGNVLVVGAPDEWVGAEFDQGAAWVFRYDGVRWNEEQHLLDLGGGRDDRFGSAVVVEGSVLAVGAAVAEAVAVFRHDGTVWRAEQRIAVPGGVTPNAFGASLDLSGDVLAVGAPRQRVLVTDQGAVHLFRFDGAAWRSEQMLSSGLQSFGQRLGDDVSIDGDTVVAGAPGGFLQWVDVGPQRTERGYAALFRRDGGAWQLREFLVSGSGVFDDRFGTSVALDGGLLCVGADFHAPRAAQQGGVFVHDVRATRTEFRGVPTPGAPVHFAVRAAPCHAGAFGFVLLGASGTGPGWELGRSRVPLVQDGLTAAGIDLGFPWFVGPLDAQGHLDLRPFPMPDPGPGFTFHAAAVLVGGPSPSFVAPSAAIAITTR